MPKKKEPPLSPEEQRKRFETMARDVGANASAEQFKKTLERLLSHKARSSLIGRPKAK